MDFLEGEGGENEDQEITNEPTIGLSCSDVTMEGTKCREDVAPNLIVKFEAEQDQTRADVEGETKVVHELVSQNDLKMKFEVDVNQIESVTVEEQDEDIQSLGLTVYNQSTLERGIWDQVEKETRIREAQEELSNVANKLKLAEEQLKRVQSANSIKKSLLQSAREEPFKKKSHNDPCKEQQETSQEKLKMLRSKQAELHARLSGAEKSKTTVSQESERERRIRMGEITPFGTSLTASSSDLSSFEKYLNSQQELHKKMMINVGAKPHPSKSKSAKKETTESSCQRSKPNRKAIPKKNILFPKKHKAKEKLGTHTSVLEEDKDRSPGFAPGESAMVDLESSGSEYVPSDDDFEPGSPEKKRNCINRSYTTSDKTFSLQSVKRKSRTDRWAGGSLKRQKKNTSMTLPYGDPEDWRSDDSDWICTDDEDCSSDDNRSKKAKHQSRRGTDDGNIEDFIGRVKQWEKQNEGLRDQMENEVHEFENDYKLPSLIWDKLYMYQQVGVRWMWELNQQRCGGILGDEMGLGKTIQIISFLAGLSISKIKCRTTGYRGLGPTLIVCPTTVMHQWVREFHTWFPPLRVAILHESGSFVGKRSNLVRNILQDKGIIITSYTAVVRLKDHLLHQRWHYVILDEGHKIRNPDAQITLAVKQLRTPHRLILSGSPLQNHLRELWSLMDFVFPGKLGTLPVFMSEFAVPINQGGYSNASEVMVATAYKCATVLRDTISPYLLRRMKADVSEHIKLPSKNEQVLFCRLTDEQRELYKEYLQCGEVGRILEGRCQIFVGLINLRKICNHPHLYSGGPKLFANEKVEDIQEDEHFGYWKKAGKMIVIEALLKMWYKQEHRVLIFTQSRQMLLIIEKFVSNRGYRYLKMDGGTSISARQPLIRKFNEDKSVFVMLLTTKVGGLGVNLTGANRVVIYDPDWNPATDTQARERAWRIGQRSAVTVYRLITAGTIEEKMYHRQIFKQFLCNKVLKDPRQRRFFKSNDLLELFTLKETDDGTTETSAIFAGTNSQVHAKSKRNQKGIKEREQLTHLRHSPKSKSGKLEIHTDISGRSSKYDSASKISFSPDKLEHMKKLAHELSLKLANKVAATARDSCDMSEKGRMEETDLPINTRNNHLQVEDIKKCPERDPKKVPDGKVMEHAEQARGACLPEDEEESQQPGTNVVHTNLNTVDKSTCIPDDSDDDLEDMKQIAQELSKELLQKVQAAATINRQQSAPKEKFKDAKSINLHKQAKFDKNIPSSSHRKPSGCQIIAENTYACSDQSPISLNMENEERYSPLPCSISADTSSHSNTKSSMPCKSTQRKHENSFLFKHKKRKKRKHKDALFEGKIVRGLVKSSTIEEKSRQEMDEEASHSHKQDDYVLRKLFSKTGLKTAMQHEKIMESGHADYMLVEGEARRVAQEAVKAIKASRQQCWTPMSGQASWTGASGRIRTRDEGGGTPEGGENRPQTSKPKFGKKRATPKLDLQATKDANEDGNGSSGLLARIRARNLLLADDIGDATANSGGSSSASDSNKELLDDIRTFVSFGASVEGRATTDEIVSQFRDRLPSESSALFKQMLMQICEFHRLPSGQGVWKLIPEFNW